jgi:hypothetical protein
VIYAVTDPVFQTFLSSGVANGRVSSKEHNLQNYAAGSFCA